MNPLNLYLTTLTISTIYVVWNRYRLYLEQRERKLRERVAYMLWCAAMRQE